MKHRGAATLAAPADESFQVEMFKASSPSFDDHVRLVGDFTRNMAARGHDVRLVLDESLPGPSPEQQSVLDAHGVRLETRIPPAVRRAGRSSQPPVDTQQASLLNVDGKPGAVIVKSINEDQESDTWLLHSREVAREFDKLWQRGMLGRGILEV